MCDSGTEQSPIDLFRRPTESTVNMSINGFGYRNYEAEDRRIWKLQSAIEVPINDGELKLTYPDNSVSKFDAVAFEFHSPSEHTIHGQHLDLEMQISHANKDGSLGAVISILFDVEKGETAEPNTANSFIDSLSFDDAENGWGVSLGEVKFATFLASVDMRKFWGYNGSWTTPPCTEGVKWIVIDEI